MDNPVEILYSWQALLVAITAAGLTQLIKTVHDVVRGPDRSIGTGKAVRKASPWLNRIVLPMIPIVFGALIGAFVPLRPDALIDYVTAKVPDWYWQDAVYGMWGAACGQFADYTFSKARDMIRAFVDSKASAATSKDGDGSAGDE